MILKTIKYVVIGGLGVVLVGGLIFGREARSYLRTGLRDVRHSVKDNVPIEFELRRARDLLAEIGPEMHRHVRLIATQEVEIGRLRGDVEASARAIEEQRAGVQKLRGMLETSQKSFRIRGATYDRQEVTEELARRLTMLKEAEASLEAKRKMLAARERSLRSAMQLVERTRSQRAQLEAQVANLESQHRLIQAASATSSLDLDTGKLAETQRAIEQVRKQLDVAERVLAHEAKFTQPQIVLDAVTEREVTAAVDEHLARTAAAEATAPTATDVEQAAARN